VHILLKWDASTPRSGFTRPSAYQISSIEELMIYCLPLAIIVQDEIAGNEIELFAGFKYGF
jgi:hypothetical protein